MNLGRMSLQRRLVGSFALIALLLLLPTGLALVRLTVLHEMAVEGREQHAAASLALGRFEAGLSELDRLQRSYLVTRDPLLLERIRASLENLRETIVPLQEPLYLEGSVSLAPIVEALVASSREIETLVREGELARADQVFGGMLTLITDARERLTELSESIDLHADREFVRAHAIISSTRAAIVVLLLVCGVLAVLLALWATRAVAGPTRRLAGAMSDVTEGTFEAPDDLPYSRRDEIGDLCVSFRTMTRRLAELDRMKAEFLGVAAHELKTPISVIAGYGELIEEDLEGELSEQQKDILHGMVEQTRIVGRLVDRLMDIGRLEAGAYRLELEPVHPRDLVQGVVQSFELMAGERGVRIRVDLDGSAPESVVVDVDQIRNEVLGNLVANAIRFVPEGGEVRIRVTGDGDEVVFTVSDDGPGIPPEHRPHVFEKYYQAERSRRVGSGLGLAITREVVELHGGEVTLLDTPGPGATFQVRLPVRPDRPEEGSQSLRSAEASPVS